MKLTPLDIKKQEFNRTFRGLDPLEVETFLEMVANEYEALLKENEQMKTDDQILRTQVKDYQKVEQTLKETLINAQESINRARVNTEKEANLIIHEAELRAEKIMDRARREVEKTKNDLTLLQAQKESFANRLKHILESQVELIKVLQIDDLQPIQAPKAAKKKKDIPIPPVIQEELPLASETQEVKESTLEPIQEPPVSPSAEVPPAETQDDDQMVF